MRRVCDYGYKGCSATGHRFAGLFLFLFYVIYWFRGTRLVYKFRGTRLASSLKADLIAAFTRSPRARLLLSAANEVVVSSFPPYLSSSQCAISLRFKRP